MRRYLAWTFALLALILAAGGGALATKYWLFHDVEHNDLLKYQLDKIEESAAVDTIFVGDSTLGNSLDSRTFDALTGRRSLNLALTGLYGYEGSLNLMRRAVERHPVKLVVVVQTLDMMQRQVSYDGFLFTTRPGYVLDVRPRHWVSLASAFLARVTDYSQLPRAIAGLLLGPRSVPIDPETDYVPQEPPLPRARFPLHGFKSESVNPAKAAFLTDIAKYCRERLLVCVYMHGPLWHPLIELSRAYVDRVNPLIEQAGLRLAHPTPLDIDESQVGDGVNHVHPKDKILFTKRYVEVLAPHLVRAHSGAQHGE